MSLHKPKLIVYNQEAFLIGEQPPTLPVKNP